MNSPPARTTLPPILAGSRVRHRSNLALALLLLPRRRRRDAFLLHDFCRTVDDIADSIGGIDEEKRAALDGWLEALRPENDHELPADFREMIARRRLDRHLLGEIILGMRMDTERNRYATFEELRLYCWRVASTVGLLSAELFGVQLSGTGGASVKRYAEDLGIALQLTNILRDVAEDGSVNRIYLPREDLERFGVMEREILEQSPSPAMTHLLNFQAERADAYFAKAELAWSEMTRHQRRLMRPARLMSAIYRDLLLQMHGDRYDVLHHRYRVGHFRKLLLALGVLSTRN